MMAVGLIGFISSMALCGMVLWFGLAGFISATATLIFFAAARKELYEDAGRAWVNTAFSWSAVAQTAEAAYERQIGG